MQVILNTDPHVDGRHQMAEHLETVVKEALGRFADHITRVEAHISNASTNHKTHVEEIQCTLEARLSHLEPVVTKDHAATPHQAIQGALGKLKRAVTVVIEKQDKTRTTVDSHQLKLDESTDPSA